MGALALTVAVVPYVLNSPGENEVVVRSASGLFSITPVTLYSQGSSSGHTSSEVFAQLSANFSGNVTICEAASTPCPAAGASAVAQHSFPSTSFFELYIPSNHLHLGSNSLELYLNSTLAAAFTLTVQSSGALLVWLDVAAALIPLLYAAGIYLGPTRSRLTLVLAIPFFVLLAAFFGHRYDLFFMISSGARVLNHVNPYVPSPAVPAFLQWIYPPLFVGYSVLAEIGYATLTGLGVPPNGLWNYPGVAAGYPYDAWRVLVVPTLPADYLLIKLPMIVATVALYLVLRDRFHQPWAEKLWLLNPLVILVGVVWGQLDVMAALCLVLALYHFSRGETWQASLLAALGAAIKVFPALLLPFILISSRNRLRDLLPVGGVGALLLGLYVYTGSVGADVSNMLSTGSYPNANGVFFAHGMTWQILLPFPHFPSLLLLIFLPFYVYQVVRYIRVKRDPTRIMIENLMVFYLTYNLVTTEYFLYPVALFLIVDDVRNSILFSVMPGIYQMLSNAIPYFMNPYFSYNYFASPMGQAAQFQQGLVTTAYLNVALALVATAIYSYTFLKTEAARGIIFDLRRTLHV